MHYTMNDTEVAFSSFYSSVGSQLQLQHADLSLSTPIHALEHDNFTGLFDDDQALLAVPIATSSTSPSSSTHKVANVGAAPAVSAGVGAGAGVGVGVGVVAGTGVVVDAGCIPFVQIHTTDLHQQSQPERSYRNGFRRKTAEIKSEAELIKSELAEAAAKERINATPTPPTAKTIVIPGDVCPDAAMTSPLHKCPNCPFLSMCQLKAQTHISSCFGLSAQSRIQCPGCDNIFYNVDVLKLHLSGDHQLEPQELSSVLLSLKLPDSGSDATSKKPHQSQSQQPLQPPKSRIFIKNVDCLREPLREQDVNQLPDFLPLTDGSTGNILDLLEHVGDVEQSQQQVTTTMPTKPPGQKISIKSVDVLREPALLPFDFQLPGAVDQQQLPPLPGMMMPGNMLDVQAVEKPRQPKIYIRNVDILKEPMLLPGMGFNDVAVPSVSSPAEVFPAETLLTPTGPVGPLPGFEPALGPLANMCGDAFNFESVLNVGGNSSGSSSSNNFSALDLDFGVDFDHNVPLVTEPTPPPPPAVISAVIPPPPPPPPPDPNAVLDSNAPQLTELTALAQDELNTQLGNNNNYMATTASGSSASKQKIFIKNVDILKAPQRGTLHLRTVDELNLMNRNEVEHLIVPHRELPLPNELPLSAAPAALPSSLVEFHQHQQEVTAPSLSYDDSFELGEDLDGWRWMVEDVPAVDTEKEASELQLPHNAEDILIKDFPQLYTPQTPDANSSPMPPLAPVTTSPAAAPLPTLAVTENLCGLPVPPLVPLAAEVPIVPAPPPAMAAVPANPATSSATAEKSGRIYVASNLLPAAVEPPLAGGTSVRGRPYGAKQAGQGKRRQAQGAAQIPESGKCTVEGCMFRFKSPATLAYHGRCHNGPLGSAQPMICPECHSTQFSNWNCLHTHLWRTHEIDMELYCCQLCSFKTPIYSRLVNTHAKIHSEERNYKCEQCGKGFKNTKQLKNHRRLHRTQGLGMPKPSIDQPVAPDTVPPTLHRCEDCGATFKHRKTLREHLCKERNEQPECNTCQRVFSSKASLKLHMRSHQANKCFKCDKCDYEANDHNAFRRHLATHRESKRYNCPHCDFKAIQSNAYRIHLQKHHSEQELSNIIHKCDVCYFTSINRGLLLVHQAKHEPTPTPAVETPSKIKVKSSLLLAHSSSTNNAKESIEEPDTSLHI